MRMPMGTKLANRYPTTVMPEISQYSLLIRSHPWVRHSIGRTALWLNVIGSSVERSSFMGVSYSSVAAVLARVSRCAMMASTVTHRAVEGKGSLQRADYPPKQLRAAK